MLFIRNFGISGYRSFGDEMMWLEDLEKVNLLIGTNNSGKSNILRYIYQRLYAVESLGVKQSEVSLFEPNDFCRFLDKGLIRVGLRCKYSRSRMSTHLLGSFQDGRVERILKNIESRIEEGTTFSFIRELRLIGGRSLVARLSVSPSIDSFVDGYLPPHLREQWDADYGFQEVCEKVWADLVKYAVSKKLKMAVSLLPAHRKLTSDVYVPGSILTGTGLIRTIGKWINFVGTEQASRQKGETLERFVRTVTGYSDAKLRVVNEDTQIEIMLGNESFSLDDMATGLHELVLLAAYCTDIEESVICLEEPETHLHPTWQRALIDYLQNDTSNQYFIATHSAHIIDIPGVPVFQVRREGKFSTVRKVERDDQTLQTLQELGYRASDLLQANYILWVEGPSDRLYLLHWLRLVAPELKEGVHFSVMHYAGSMLGHLSGNQLDEDPEAFGQGINVPIQIARLNQNYGVVMDSDWTSSSAPDDSNKKWQTKQKCRKELQSQGKLAWITDGRTTENYCVVDDLTSAVNRLNTEYKYEVPQSEFELAFTFLNTNGKKCESKVPLANAYILVQNELADAHVAKSESSGDSQVKRAFLLERLKQEPTGKLYDHLVKLASAIHAVQGEPIPPSA